MQVISSIPQSVQLRNIARICQPPNSYIYIYIYIITESCLTRVFYLLWNDAMYGGKIWQIVHLIPLKTINIVSYNKFSKPWLGWFSGLTIFCIITNGCVKENTVIGYRFLTSINITQIISNREKTIINVQPVLHYRASGAMPQMSGHFIIYLATRAASFDYFRNRIIDANNQF